MLFYTRSRACSYSSPLLAVAALPALATRADSVCGAAACIGAAGANFGPCMDAATLGVLTARVGPLCAAFPFTGTHFRWRWSAPLLDAFAYLTLFRALSCVLSRGATGSFSPLFGLALLAAGQQ